MRPQAGFVAYETLIGRLPLSTIARWASLVFCALLPVCVLAVLFATTIEDDTVAFDFRPFYRAAGAILDGESPYPAADDPLTAESGAYVYPPLPALLTVPLRVLPADVAGVLVMLFLCGAVVATLLTLGIRDWRCYGAAFLWPPVLSAVQTGNLTLLLALAAAVAWRYRGRTGASAVAVGAAVAAKFFFWPLVFWFAATRRIVTAVLACATALALLLGSWAVIGFRGMRDYPELMRRLEDSVGADSYTAYIVGLDLGLPAALSRGVWLGLGCALLVALVVVARRGDEQTAFVLAIAAALALTPIVWLHYFALLLVVVALAQPRLGFLWFAPIMMLVTPGSGQPTPFETAWTLGVATLVFVLALRGVRNAPRPEGPHTIASSSAYAGAS